VRRSARKTPSAELSRLWLYRLGLSGVNAKYRVVPRSAIVDYDGLEGAVRSWSGERPLHDTIHDLWQRHGAPSPAVVDEFLMAAADLDQGGASEAAKRRVLERWLRACRPPSRVTTGLEFVELGVGFVLRRIRQRTFKRPFETGRETLTTLRRSGVR
jgi:hypothetical protein